MYLKAKNKKCSKQKQQHEGDKKTENEKISKNVGPNRNTSMHNGSTPVVSWYEIDTDATKCRDNASPEIEESMNG